MSFISLSDWQSYQHYKDRDPSWVKLYRSILTTEAWVLGTDLSRLVQVASILLAARYNNKIPLNFQLIKKVACLDCEEAAFMAALAHLEAHKFLEIQGSYDECKQPASTALASCTTTSGGLYLEKRREEERREEKNRMYARAREGKERKHQDDHAQFERVKAAYPRFAGRQDWINAEHACHLRIEQDGQTWDDLIDAAKRYAAYCDATERTGTNFVMTPGRFFSAADRPWLQPWDLPEPKRSARNGTSYADVMAALDAVVDPDSEDFEP